MKIGIDYCPNPASKEFQELKSIFGEAKAYLLWDRNHGNPLDKAPNGALSKLFLSLLEYYNGDRKKALVAKSKVYSDEFFNWFGDWTVTKTPQKNFEHSLFRGQASKPRIDNHGNLVLHPTYDNLSKNTGISFANVEGAAIEYGSRYSKNPYIIEIDADYLDKTHPLKETTESKGRFIGDEYGENAWEERISDTEDIIIPKGYYKIKHEAPNFSELSDVELRAKIDELKELYNNQDEWVDEAYAPRTSKSEIREYQEELNRRNKEYNKKYKTVYYDLKVNKTNSTVDSNSYTSNEAGEALHQLIYDNRESYMITEEQYKDIVSGKDVIIKAQKQEKRDDYVEDATPSENSVSKVVDENGEPLLDSIYDSYYIEQQLNPIEKEMADIKAKAIADGTFMKAPNGKPTNLTERQWLQVRTKAFKKWFGDWERVARSSKYRRSKNIPNSITSATYQGVTVSDVKFDPDMAPDGGTRIIYLGDEYIGEIPVFESDNTIRMGGSIGAATEIEEVYRGKGYGKKAHIALANIAKSEGKVLYSDSSNSDAEDALWKSLVGEGIAEVVSEKPKIGNWNHTTYRIINDALPQADDVNPGDREVSKVVDENGEPLVVYRGDSKGKTQFNPTKPSYNVRGIYFAGNKAFGSNYTKPSFYNNYTEGILYEVFVNARNPIYNSRDVEGWDNGKYNINDSWIYGRFPSGNGELVVRNSNQIKSATDNNGEFSTENDDINYHILKSRAERLSEWLEKLGYIHKYKNYYILNKVPNARPYVEGACKRANVKYYIDDKEKFGNKFTLVRIYQTVTADSKIKPNEEKITNLAQTLSNKFPGITFHLISEKNIPYGINKKAAAWCKDGVVYLIRERINEEITLEEFLHPFVAILQKYNKDYFNDLLNEIKKLYPEMVRDINAAYSNDDGFNQNTRDNEYVAQGLAKAMHENKHKNEKVADIVRSFGQWFIELLKLFSEYLWRGYTRGTVHTLDPTKIKNLTVGELARLLNADDIEVDMSRYEGNSKTYYHMADPNATMDDISAEINKLFKILYDAYRKIPNKTEQQQRIQNKVFENLTQLRALRDITSIQIALKTGLDIIGTIDYSTGLPGDPNSVLGKLHALEQSTVPYSAATAKELVEMYRNSIGFFKSMLSDMPDSFEKLTADTNLATALKKMRDDLQNRLNDANNKWKIALVSVTDKIVEEQIDSEVSLSQELKDDMKTVYKDWLHTNLYYGDISAASSLLVNYGQNNNPIIRLAFHMIQRAESKIQFESLPIGVKITKLYQRAQKEHLLNPDWQTVYMEFDKDGIPTGNWVRDINYGQYAKDVNDFVDKLNEEFLSKYKFYYILDDNDVLVNSATLLRGDEEEWVGNVEPPYVEYMRRIEQYKCSRAYRRYTYDYYKERFSRPYSQSYPSGHGLSPRTLSKYNRILSNINYYLDLCTDKITGLHHPENLSDENKKKLDLWKHELDKLSDVFDEDGWLKTDEDLQMAEEIRAWESWIGEKMVTQTDLDLFLQERAEIETRVQNGEIPPKILTDFDRYNATFGINQDFINQTIGQFDNPKGEPSDVVEARMRRRCIADMVKLPFNKLDRDMSNFEDKKQLWVYLKLYDQTVEDGRVTRSKDMAEEFDKNFFMKDVLYRDENGYAVDTQGNIVLPQDENSRRDLLTFYEYMVQKYTDEALSSGTIAGLVDLQGNVYHFSGSRDEIESQVRELLSYTRRYTDSEGNLVEEQVPLTIFKVMYPRLDTFYNARTGRTENTLEYVPTGRFSYKTDNWANTSVKYVEDPANYDRTSLQAEQPKRQYYDNSELYKKATSGETGKLYDMLIQQMKDSQQDYNFGNPIFDYKLPQINATNGAVLSRCLKNGVGATMKYISDSINTIQENDDDMRSTKSGVVNPDGTFATDVPRRYINPLKDPATITHNITGAVMMYMHAAKNYKYKTIIEGQLEALRYAMDDDNREKDAVSVLHSKTTFDSMMDKHMYGNQWGNRNLNSQSGYDVARQKTLRNAHRLESVQMLGLNIISMTVGGSDSICKMFRDAIAAKHFSVRDLITGITSTLLHLPLLISNLGNPVANNKLVGVNLLFGIGKDYKMIYEHQDYGRMRKFVTNFLMGGYSMIDYVNNSILLRSNLSGIRFYNGNKIPKGFYTKWEMLQAFVLAGYSIYQGTLAHMCCTKTLWGAIKYKHGYTWISDDYSQYVSEKIMSDVRTRTLQRGGLYNGMNPDNDIPRYKLSVLWAIPLAMRAWLLQQWLHLFLGLDDTSVREFYEKDEESRKGLFKKRRTRRYMKKRTDEQRANRLTWNFETGVPQDEIGNGLSRSFVTLMKKLYAFVTLNKQKLKNVKFSYVERYALRDAVITLSLIHALMVSWIDVHHWASSAYQYKPENKQEASLDYLMLHFFDHDTYKMFIDDVYFRTIESQLSGVNPTTVSDILNSITVLKSGVTEHMGLLKSAADLSGLSGKDLSEEVIRGKYKYFSRGERSIYQFFGPLDNLYTSFTFQGLYNNELYYWNAYGAPIRSLYGYDFKQELEEQKETFGRPVIKRPTINRPVIIRPTINRPTIR